MRLAREHQGPVHCGEWSHWGSGNIWLKNTNKINNICLSQKLHKGIVLFEWDIKEHEKITYYYLNWMRWEVVGLKKLPTVNKQYLKVMSLSNWTQTGDTGLKINTAVQLILLLFTNGSSQMVSVERQLSQSHS